VLCIRLFSPEPEFELTAFCPVVDRGCLFWICISCLHMQKNCELAEWYRLHREWVKSALPHSKLLIFVIWTPRASPSPSSAGTPSLLPQRYRVTALRPRLNSFFPPRPSPSFLRFQVDFWSGSSAQQFLFRVRPTQAECQYGLGKCLRVCFRRGKSHVIWRADL
jgi:hypothetical protein